MRWERLFDDLQAQLDDEERSEREALVAELQDEDWSQTSWADRLAGRIEIDVQGVGRLSATVLDVADEVLHLEDERFGSVVARDAVVAVLASEGPTAPVSAVRRRLGWPSLLRAARDAGEEIEVLDRYGGAHAGAVEAVGSDHVTLVGPDGRRRQVVLAAVAVVRIRR